MFYRHIIGLIVTDEDPERAWFSCFLLLQVLNAQPDMSESGHVCCLHLKAPLMIQSSAANLPLRETSEPCQPLGNLCTG